MGGKGSGRKAKGVRDKKVYLGGVYLMINEVNGFVYVGGSAKNLQQRISYHYSQLKLGRHPNKGLQRDWYAVGGKFRHEIAVICEGMKKVKAEEQRLIEYYKEKGIAYNQNNNYKITNPKGNQIGSCLEPKHYDLLRRSADESKKPIAVKIRDYVLLGLELDGYLETTQ